MRTQAISRQDNNARGSDNLIMTVGTDKPGSHVLRGRRRARLTRRTLDDIRYAIVSLPLAVLGVLVLAGSLSYPALIIAATPAARWLGSVNRSVLARLLGERVPAPPPMRKQPSLHVRTADPVRLAGLVSEAGGVVRRQHRGRIAVTGLTAGQLAALAAGEGVPVRRLTTDSGWWGAAARDRPAWRARAYLALKLPVALGMFAAPAAGIVGIWVGLLAHSTYGFEPFGSDTALILLLMAAGTALTVATQGLTHAAVSADRRLIRALLGPPLTQRVADLEQTRAHAVDDSVARLRDIERDLHDGAQAQLVGLAMKLGLARQKLGAGAGEGTLVPAELDRAIELVDAAHRGAIEAITELRVLARGIHPPVLDNGLPDALATLAARSAVPVELVTDIPQRPSAAIETIGYFCAAELITNVAKHSGARHASLEAVHVPGLLRIRVSDDGRGGARPDAGGGLAGLAGRVRTVDGRIEIASPDGGPTEVTVELPSHA